MVEEVNDILDGVQDSEVEASDLRDEEVSVAYEDQEWSAEVRVDDIDGEEYVQVSYNVESMDAKDISNLAQATKEDELRWGRNNGLDRKAPNIVDASDARMSIPVSRMDHSRMSAVIPEWEQELLDREYAEQIADEFGFEKDTSTHYGEWKYDVLSTDAELSREEVIESIVDRDESYIITIGSNIAVQAEKKPNEDAEIEETVELTAKTGEQNSATFNVYIPIENGVGIDNYSDLGVSVSDEYRRKVEEVMENLDGYTKAMVDRDSEASGRTVRIPDSEILTQIERQIGQGDQVRIQ